MENDNRALRRKAFNISIAYVGLGTITDLCLYPPYYGDWVLVLLIFTFPVSIIGVGIMYAGRENYLILLAVQLVIFLIMWKNVYGDLTRKYKSRR